MIFCGVFLVFFTYFYSCSALLCTTSCAFTYNLSTPFSIPDRCNQLISAGKCLGDIIFWYDHGIYQVFLETDSSSSIDPEDNKRYVVLDVSRAALTGFSYLIDRACNNRDDCVRQLIGDVANEMLKKDYNYSGVLNELKPLITSPPSRSLDSNLECYNSNGTVNTCGTSPLTSSCAIIDAISQKKLSMTCETDLYAGNPYVAIYQSSADDASFDVHCNRSLCNTRSILDAVKELVFKYGITVTPDGRLVNESTSTTSTLIHHYNVLGAFLSILISMSFSYDHSFGYQ